MSENWSVDCSDEEIGSKVEEWQPPVEEILKYYEILERGQIPEISWRAPAYRAPSPDERTQTPTNEIEDQPSEEKSDFDFMDEMSAPGLRVRKEGVLRGSAKKKTTSLDGVLSNMRRHKQKAQIEIPSQTKTDH